MCCMDYIMKQINVTGNIISVKGNMMSALMTQIKFSYQLASWLKRWLSFEVVMEDILDFLASY